MMTSFHLRNWCGHLRPLHFRDNILMTTMAQNIISTILMSDLFSANNCKNIPSENVKGLLFPGCETFR